MNKNVFLFSGQGSQYFRMGEQLYQNDERFRTHMDQMDRIPKKLIKRSVIDILYNENHKKSEEFKRTLHTHPAIFMVEYCLARTLMDYGILPDILIGASLGEYVALSLAHVIDAKTLLEILIRNAEVIEETCEPGCMIGIVEDPSLYEEEPLIHENSSLVGINFDRHFVISGFQENMVKILEYLDEKKKLYQELPVSHGFHSPNVDPAFAFCRKNFSLGETKKPTIDIISCLTGEKINKIDDRHFWDIATQKVRFRKALRTLGRESNCDYNIIDVGPAGTYAGFVKQNRVLENAMVFHIMTHFGGELRNLDKIRNELKKKPVQHQMKDTMQAIIFPGQGSQVRGMGKDLFGRYKEHLGMADEILGFSIEDLCLNDPGQNLRKTRYTQPALFVVNALAYLDFLEEGQALPDFVAGHSLGEFNALFAANVIDFKTGLKLVKKRGELMEGVQNGGMAAVIGMGADAIAKIIDKNQFQQIEIANLNSPSQIVLSGDKSQIEAAQPFFEADGKARYVVLNVSGAFHSKFMETAGRHFSEYLSQFDLSAPEIPVVSNVLARPYSSGDIRELLIKQLTHPVKWMESICYMWGKGVENFVEIGPGNTLTGLVRAIKKEAQPLKINGEEVLAKTKTEPSSNAVPSADTFLDAISCITPTSLGCNEYKHDYNLTYAYAAGGMVHGIASKEMVVKMGKAGMIGYFGTGALSLEQIEAAIVYIQQNLDQGQAYGMNLLSGPKEEERVDLFLKHRVSNVEAAAYVQVTPALVRYKLNGLSRNPDGSTHISNRIMGKLSRPEVAFGFLSPAPGLMVEKLVKEGKVTGEQASLAQNLPMADDICVEADSGGHTDMGVASALMPAIIHLRNEMVEKHHYLKKIRIGAAGGIGTPDAAAAAFMLGADFILTGSINQCSVEAGTSDLVKDLLQEMNVQDTAYAPAGDMFEMGSKVQVLKRGVFFPARANKLYELYRHYNSLDEIDEKTRNQLENKYFKRSFESIWEECVRFYPQDQIQRAIKNPKQKMAFIFKWYFNYTTLLALEGQETSRVDFQICCGPALGAFNQWVKGTPLEKWQNRHVDEIGKKLMTETSELIVKRFRQFSRKD